MNKIETIIEEKLSNWDPFNMVLFKNQREYDIEAELIAQRISQIHNCADLMTLIKEVFKICFGTTRKIETKQFEDTANSIWNELLSLNVVAESAIY